MSKSNLIAMIFSRHVESDVVQTKFAAAAASSSDSNPFDRAAVAANLSEIPNG